jgi:hypothetical protein
VSFRNGGITLHSKSLEAAHGLFYGDIFFLRVLSKKRGIVPDLVSRIAFRKGTFAGDEQLLHTFQARTKAMRIEIRTTM